MALFRLGAPSEISSFVRGEGVFLRPPEPRDYEAWSDLREKSRAFLTPWEPTWPGDDLTRTSFRRRLRRNLQEMSNDEAYPFFIFRDDDDRLVGGLTLGQVKRGRRAIRNARLLDGDAPRGQGIDVARGKGNDWLCLHLLAPASDRGRLPAA